MQADINEPKSRAFNICLRFLQFGLSLALAAYICHASALNCTSTLFTVTSVSAYALIGLNCIAIIYLRCRERFPSAQFFVALTINLVLTAVVLITSFTGLGETNACPQNIVSARLFMFASVHIALLSLLILLGSFFWIQRLSNSPGNLVWPCMFFGLAWPIQVYSIMTMIGLLTLAVSLLTLSVNIVAKLKGPTTSMKKWILGTWVFCLLLMLIYEILAIVGEMKIASDTTVEGIETKKLLLVLIGVNILEGLFWLFGLMTLHYENGDKIRDAMLTFGSVEEDEYPVTFQEDAHYQASPLKGIGTIK